MLRGGRLGLRAQLAAHYSEQHGKTARASSLADALLTIEGKAMRTTKALALRRRGRTDKGDIVVDLGTQNGMVVVVSPDGWELMPTSPVLFRRTELSAPLPIPVRSAPSTDLLFEHLNVSECHGLLVVGWIVSTFVPDIAHCIPALFGEQGTAKTTTTGADGLVGRSVRRPRFERLPVISTPGGRRDIGFVGRRDRQHLEHP